MRSVVHEGRHVVEVRPAGIERWLVVMLVSAWLTGWACGEAFALKLLHSAFTAPHAGLPRLLPGPGGVMLLLVVLVWTTVWTSFGIMAGYALLSRIFGRDRIEYDSSGVRHVFSIGPWRRSRWLARQEIEGIGLREQSVALRVRGRSIVLTRFGSNQDRSQLRAELERVLDLGKLAARTEDLPSGWEYGAGRDGIAALRRSPPLLRRRAALFMLGFLAVAPLSASLIQAAARGEDDWMGAIMWTLLALALGGLAAWKAFGGQDIHLRRGRADVVRRLGWMRWTATYEPAALALERQVDKNGEEYRLVIYGLRGYRMIAQVLGDPVELRRVGAWMAARLGVELETREGPRPLRILRRRSG